MKLSSDKDTMAELKALILYILYKINKPITNDEFLKLVLLVVYHLCNSYMYLSIL